jgi:general secretion pathway protein D
MKTDDLPALFMPVAAGRAMASTLVHARRALSAVTCVLVLALAVGCAGLREHQQGMTLVGEGKYEAGLAKLEEAVQLSPRNAEYRLSLSSQRTSVMNRLIDQGERSLRAERLEDAEAAYRRVLGLDDANVMARQGLAQAQRLRWHRQRLSEAEALLKRGSEDDLNEALEKLRPVLVDNPSYRAAIDLRGRVQAAREKLTSPEARLAATFRRPITLEFRDAPLKSIFDVVAKVSGLNIYFDKEVRTDTRTSITIRNSSIDEAVRLLLAMNQLEQKVLNENSVLIYPSTASKLKEHQTLLVRSFYLTNADPKAVVNSIKTIVKTKDITFDDRLGVIVIRDTPAAVRMAERIVALQDLTDPEVMLEVEVLEIKRSRLLELGVKWPSQLTLTPLDDTLTLSELRGLSSGNTRASVGGVTVSARKDDQDGTILANPRIRVRNREKAKVLIGDKVPVITTTAGSTGFVAESVAYVDVGIKLEVEPTIHLDDQVAIKVNLEVSNIVREMVSSKTGTNTYQIGTRGANTVLRLRDGETQVLAGLISDEDRSTSNRVPLLGQLPVVGRLFGSQKDDTQRTEILLSITPRVVRSVDRPSIAEAEFESGTESNIGMPSLRVRPSGTPLQTSSQPDPAGAKALQVSWSAPDKVKVGEVFTAKLLVDASTDLRQVPMLLGYDHATLEIVSVEAGDFFQRGGDSGTFTHRIEKGVGRVVASVGRANETTAASGRGALVTVAARVTAPTPDPVRLRLISMSPEPANASRPFMPIEHTLRVVE